MEEIQRDFLFLLPEVNLLSINLLFNGICDCELSLVNISSKLFLTSSKKNLIMGICFGLLDCCQYLHCHVVWLLSSISAHNLLWNQSELVLHTKITTRITMRFIQSIPLRFRLLILLAYSLWVLNISIQ